MCASAIARRCRSPSLTLRSRSSALTTAACSSSPPSCCLGLFICSATAAAVAGLCATLMPCLVCCGDKCAVCRWCSATGVTLLCHCWLWACGVSGGALFRASVFHDEELPPRAGDARSSSVREDFWRVDPGSRARRARGSGEPTTSRDGLGWRPKCARACLLVACLDCSSFSAFFEGLCCHW